MKSAVRAGPSSGPTVRGVDASSLVRWGRRHLPFLVALVGGVAIRAVVFDAYRPAILFPDSYGYLRSALHLELSQLRPSGYSLLLWPLRQLAPSSIEPIVVLQHLLGLVLAVLCYAFLVKRGLPRWGATLATLPLLFDPLQLVLEHYVLSDVAFEFLLVAGCLLLLWNPRPATWQVALAGLAVASSALVRGAGTFVLIVFVIAVLCLRLEWRKLLVLIVAAALPLVAYATAYQATFGVFALSQGEPRFLYARVAPIVRCDDPRLELPSYEKVLCPTQPVGERPGSNYYMWGLRPKASNLVHPPAGVTGLEALHDFGKRVIRAQPREFTMATLDSFVHGFAPTRTKDVDGFRARNWLFQDHYWMRTEVWHPTAEPGPAKFLQNYRTWLWTPGPLLGILLITAAVATLGVGRARRSGDRVAIGLLAGSCVVTLLTGAALSGFSWRYQLPQLALLPMAGALAVAALARGPAPGRPPPPPPLRVLDRAARVVAARIPFLSRAQEHGLLAVWLAVATGALVAVAVAVAAWVSGWFLADTAAWCGLAAGVLVVLGLVVADRRAAADARDDGGGHGRGTAVGVRRL